MRSLEPFSLLCKLLDETYHRDFNTFSKCFSKASKTLSSAQWESTQVRPFLPSAVLRAGFFAKAKKAADSSSTFPGEVSTPVSRITAPNSDCGAAVATTAFPLAKMPESFEGITRSAASAPRIKRKNKRRETTEIVTNLLYCIQDCFKLVANCFYIKSIFGVISCIMRTTLAQCGIFD